MCYFFYRLLQYGYRALGYLMIISTLFNFEMVAVNCAAVIMADF